MKTKFKCDYCKCETEGTFKSKIDKEKLKEIEDDKKILKKKKKDVEKKYNSFRQEYEKWDNRGYIKKLLNFEKPSYDDFVWKRHYEIWRKRLDMSYTGLYLHMSAKYIECPVCKEKNYF